MKATFEFMQQNFIIGQFMVTLYFYMRGTFSDQTLSILCPTDFVLLFCNINFLIEKQIYTSQ